MSVWTDIYGDLGAMLVQGFSIDVLVLETFQPVLLPCTMVLLQKLALYSALPLVCTKHRKFLFEVHLFQISNCPTMTRQVNVNKPKTKSSSNREAGIAG